MSRQNKVNPGMYTQRGRLTQDDAARELRKQSAFGSPHTWQPVNTRKPRLAPAGDAVRDEEVSADVETTKAAASARAKARPASRVARKTKAATASPSKARPSATKKTAASRKSKGAGTRARKSTSTSAAAKARKTATRARKQTTATRRKR